MTIREDKYGNAVQASRPGVSQSLAVGATSVSSTTFAAGNQATNRRQDTGAVVTPSTLTQHVRLIATTQCWVSFGTTPAAVAKGSTSMFLPAGLPEYFWVRRGERIAVIQDATAGFLYITELAQD